MNGLSSGPVSRSLLAAAVAVWLTLSLAGCGRDARLSQSAADITLALVSVAANERPAAVARIETIIDGELAAARLTEREAGDLRALTALCHDGRWEDAHLQAQAALQSQLRPAR